MDVTREALGATNFYDYKRGLNFKESQENLHVAFGFCQLLIGFVYLNVVERS